MNQDEINRIHLEDHQQNLRNEIRKKLKKAVDPYLRNYQDFLDNVIKSILIQKVVFDSKLHSDILYDDLLSDQLENKCFFVTFHPVKSKNHNNGECGAFMFEGIHAFYRDMVGKLIKKPEGRHAVLSPLMIAHLDVEGTRYGVTSLVEKPHAHAIILFHPKTVASFSAYLKEHGRWNAEEGSFRVDLPENHYLESVTFKPFENVFESLDKMISYVTKFARSARLHDDCGVLDGMKIFPQLPPNLYPFFKRANIAVLSSSETGDLERKYAEGGFGCRLISQSQFYNEVQLPSNTRKR